MNVLDETALRTELRSGSIDPIFADKLASAIAQDPMFLELPPDGTLAAMIGRFVIRPDDANLFEHAAEMVQSAASVGFFVGVASADALLAAKVALAIELFKIGKEFVTRGAIVSKDELRILLTLRGPSSDKGMSAIEIAKSLNEESSLVEARLARLSSYPLRKATRSFVERIDDHWHLRV